MNITNMHYLLSRLLPFAFVVLLLNEVSLVAAGGNQSWLYGKLSPRRATDGGLNVTGLEVLKTYVCSPCANAIRRQVDTKKAGTVTVAVPIAEASQLWQELRWIMEQLRIILEAEGLLSSSIFPTSLPTGLATLIDSAVPAALLPSGSIEVGSSSMTGSAVATPMPRIAAMATSSPPETASGNIPDHKLHVVGFTAGPLKGSTAGATTNRPGFATTSSPGPRAAATSRDSPASSLAASPDILTLLPQGSACYPTQTIDETTTVSLVAVTEITDPSAFEAPAPDMSHVGGTLVKSASNSLASGANPPKGGVFIATSVSSAQPTSTGTASYTFDSQSTQNIAVYFGQSGTTGQTTLEAQCADPNIDIVILAFVITDKYQGKYPDINFGAACGGQTSKMVAEAPGLLSCPKLESYIDICQQTYGKKVLLSIGGSTSSLSFTSSADASDFANILWQLFGPPGRLDIDLRPFGNVSIDGFDVGKHILLCHTR
jgi:hypothetical protein